MKNASLFATVCLLMLSACVCAVEIKGAVTAVGKEVKIRIKPGAVPNIGDKVEISGTIPGIGEVPLNGTWKVTAVENDVVTAATEDPSAGTPQPGYMATIFTAQAAPEKPPEPNEPTKKPTAPDKPPVESIKPDVKTARLAEARHYRGYIGAQLKPHEVSGLQVLAVEPDSPARRAGLEPNDIVLELADSNYYATQKDTSVFDERLTKLGEAGDKAKIVFTRSRTKRQSAIQPILRPYLGIKFKTQTAGGLVIQSVEPNSPADLAGIAAGDLLVRYDRLNFWGQSPNTSLELVRAVAASRFDTPVAIAVSRDNRLMNKTVTFSRPAPSAQAAASTAPPKPPDAIQPLAQVDIGQAGQVIFADNFDNGGQGRANLHYRGLTKWLVQRGEIDLIGNGFQDHQPGNGLYLDLRGTPFNPGSAQTQALIATKEPLILNPGAYRLVFSLAGNPDQGPDTVRVQIGSIFSERFTMNKQAVGTGFKKIERTFIVTQPARERLTFQEETGTGGGMLLDDIVLQRTSN